MGALHVAGCQGIDHLAVLVVAGNEVVEALNNNDLPVVMGATLVFACIFVLINMVVDVIYGLLDPRVRIK